MKYTSHINNSFIHKDSFKFSFLGNFVLAVYFHYPLENQSAIENIYIYSILSQQT
jgi:hypothetical protein